MAEQSNFSWTAAGGVVTGSLHRKLSRNGQDAVSTWTDASCAIAVVADGCGSAPGSEVGARLGVAMWQQAVLRRVAVGADLSEPAEWTAIRAEVAAHLHGIAAATSNQFVLDHLLFTSLIAVVTPHLRAVYGIGDGVYGSDTDYVVLAANHGNQPDYLAYDFCGEAGADHLTTWASCNAGCLWIGTDGIGDLAQRGDPALKELIADERVSAQPDRVRRKLEVLARGETLFDWEARRVNRVPGRLTDDGAFAIIRWGAVI